MKPIPPGEDIAIKTLLITDLVGSTLIFDQLGDQRASEISLLHERMARDLLERSGGREIDKTDGFLMVFDRPLDAVQYALSYHAELEKLSRTLDVKLRARAGVHLGEVILRDNPPEDVARGAKPLEVEGQAKPTAARVMALASGGQTLVTRGVFDLTRRAVVGRTDSTGELRWEYHGAYLLKGIEEPLEVFEVGYSGEAPFVAPRDSEKGRRIRLGSDTLEGIPEKIGRYQIVSQIGKGGQSRTYRAYDPTIDRDVLIKRMMAENLSSSLRASFRQRFVLEAKAAGQLSHTNIACIYDVGTAAGEPYIAMEFVEGDSLDRVIVDQSPLSPDQIIDIFEQLCAALQHAHDRGIVHRDVKPGNIMIDPTGRVKIVDFGIARLSSSNLTQTGAFLGTPYYMSPEQIRGFTVDHRSDIFSCGVVLYQLLTGAVPFDGETPTAVIFKIVNDQYKPATDRMPGIPDGFDDILEKALAKDPAKRYQNCSELAQDLTALRDDQVPENRRKESAGYRLVGQDGGPSKDGRIDGKQTRPGEVTANHLSFRAMLYEHRFLAAGVTMGGLGLILIGLAFVLWQTTEQHLDEVSALDFPPSLVEPPVPESSEAIAMKAEEKGREAFHSGEFEEAIRQLEVVTNLDPENANVSYLLGQAYSLRGRRGSALNNFSRAVELEPNRVDYVVFLGLELAKSKRYTEACVQLERSIALGGMEGYSREQLRLLLAEFSARRDLARVLPLSASMEHDHLLGGCSGVLNMTETHLSFESEKNRQHSFTVEISAIDRVEERADGLVFSFETKNYRFKSEAFEPFLTAYQLLQQIDSQASR